MAKVTPEVRRQALESQVKIGRELESLTRHPGWKVFETAMRQLADSAWASAKAAADWDSFREHRTRAQTFEFVIEETYREVEEARLNAKHLAKEETKT